MNFLVGSALGSDLIHFGNETRISQFGALGVGVFEGLRNPVVIRGITGLLPRLLPDKMTVENVENEGGQNS